MAPSTLQHRRTHNLLLINKLLNQRDVSSPFTLVLDNLEQTARPLVSEFLRRANGARIKCIFVSFETLKQPKDVDAFIPAWRLSVKEWQSEVAKYLKAGQGQRHLLVFDALNPLASTTPQTLPSILSSLISPTTSLLATYHTDIPLSPPPETPNPYAPPPLKLLKYLATTILSTHSLHHVLAAKTARERSVVEPEFGLGEGVEGVVQGLGSNGVEGVVVEMEHRRRSGRGVGEWYFLPLSGGVRDRAAGGKAREGVMLLEDHPDYAAQTMGREEGEGDEAQEGSTFELGLSERQRQDREGVVLPYFDAQKGGGEGGRILYDMGSEDDFDEEEDEI